MKGPESIHRTKQDLALNDIFNANQTSHLQYIREKKSYSTDVRPGKAQNV